ncbi:MAG: nucleoside-diphosphate kinase [Tannerella sp.]|jgi:nucleoside-diphosphate kinase|nr:nucleoside-diphosphate kinase [Tannerella sp.]
MATNITLTMIKPDAVANGYIGNIISDITSAGFSIVALKLTQLTVEDAERFYAEHKGKGFYDDLIAFMTSGPIVAAVLKKENAVEEYRKLIGATNPEKAEEGTIRKKYAESMTRNAVHGADSDASADREAHFHFSDREIFYQL